MSVPTHCRNVAPLLRRCLPPVLFTLLGLAAGVMLVVLLRDPHTATAQRLTGTVVWSNEETRLIAFEADGAVPDPRRGETHYWVLGDWVDAAGTLHGSASTYPTCLAGVPDDPVRTDRRRVQLEVIDWDTGGVQKQHIAASVRCLD